MAAKVKLRLAQFRKYAGLKWPDTSDEHKARSIGVDPATFSRITNGRQAPGERFIAALLAAFQADRITFDDLFEVETDEEPVSA